MSPLAPPDDDLDNLTNDLADFGGEFVDPTPRLPSTSTYGYMGLPADPRVRQSTSIAVQQQPRKQPSFEELTKDLKDYGGELVAAPTPIPTSREDLTKDLAEFGGELVRPAPITVPDERQFTSNVPYGPPPPPPMPRLASAKTGGGAVNPPLGEGFVPGERIPEGVRQIAKGVSTFAAQPRVLPTEAHVLAASTPQESRAALNAASDLMEGAGKVATPLAVAGAVVNFPVAAAAYGLMYLSSSAADQAAQYAGADEDQRRFISNLVATGVAVLGAHRVAKGLTDVAANTAEAVKSTARAGVLRGTLDVAAIRAQARAQTGAPIETRIPAAFSETVTPARTGETLREVISRSPAAEWVRQQSEWQALADLERHFTAEAPIDVAALSDAELLQTVRTGGAEQVQFAKAELLRRSDAVARGETTVTPPEPTTATPFDALAYLRPEQRRSDEAEAARPYGTLDVVRDEQGNITGVQPTTAAPPPAAVTAEQADVEQVNKALEDVTYFRSGIVNAPADFAGLAGAQVPIGITHRGVTPAITDRTIEYVKNGGQVFVDSGAVGVLRGAPPPDFNAVLDYYNHLADNVGPERASGLFVVAPDVVGNFEETRAVQTEHGDAIRQLMLRGVNVIVPVQKSEQASLGEQMQWVQNTVRPVGPDHPLVFGIPFNKFTYNAEEIAAGLQEFDARLGYHQPASIHLLGIGPTRRSFAKTVETIRAAAPDVTISSDSERTQAMFVSGRPWQKRREQLQTEQGLLNAHGAKQYSNEGLLLDALWNGDLSLFTKGDLQRIATALELTVDQMRQAVQQTPEAFQARLQEHTYGGARQTDAPNVEEVIWDIAVERGKQLAGPGARTQAIQESQQPAAPAAVAEAPAAEAPPRRTPVPLTRHEIGDLGELTTAHLQNELDDYRDVDISTLPANEQRDVADLKREVKMRTAPAVEAGIRSLTDAEVQRELELYSEHESDNPAHAADVDEYVARLEHEDARRSSIRQGQRTLYGEPHLADIPVDQLQGAIDKLPPPTPLPPERPGPTRPPGVVPVIPVGVPTGLRPDKPPKWRLGDRVVTPDGAGVIQYLRDDAVKLRVDDPSTWPAGSLKQDKNNQSFTKWIPKTRLTREPVERVSRSVMFNSATLEDALSPAAQEHLAEWFRQRNKSRDLRHVRAAMEVYDRLLTDFSSRVTGKTEPTQRDRNEAAEALRNAVDAFFSGEGNTEQADAVDEAITNGLTVLTGDPDPAWVNYLAEEENFASARDAGQLIFDTLDPQTASFDTEAFNTAYGEVEFRRPQESVFPEPKPEDVVNYHTELTNVPVEEGSSVPNPNGGPTIAPTEAAQRLAEWKAEAKRIGQEEDHSHETIFSLFDVTGVWSQPYVDAGYRVVRYDIKNGDDLMNFGDWMGAIEEEIAEGQTVVGVIGAPPCTSFAISGNRWWHAQHAIEDESMVAKKYGLWASKVFKRPIDYANTLVAVTKLVVEQANPRDFYAIENPVGRMRGLNAMPTPMLTFDPSNFGDPYTKVTQLWGEFNAQLPTANVVAVEGSKIHKLRGDVEEDKAARSETPEGFAYAFFMANHQPALAVPEHVEPPAVTFEIGNRVVADEGTGTIHAIRDDDVKIRLDPAGQISKWIPKERVEHEVDEEEPTGHVNEFGEVEEEVQPGDVLPEDDELDIGETGPVPAPKPPSHAANMRAQSATPVGELTTEQLQEEFDYYRKLGKKRSSEADRRTEEVLKELGVRSHAKFERDSAGYWTDPRAHGVSGHAEMIKRIDKELETATGADRELLEKNRAHHERGVQEQNERRALQEKRQDNITKFTLKPDPWGTYIVWAESSVDNYKWEVKSLGTKDKAEAERILAQMNGDLAPAAPPAAPPAEPLTYPQRARLIAGILAADPRLRNDAGSRERLHALSDAELQAKAGQAPEFAPPTGAAVGFEVGDRAVLEGGGVVTIDLIDGDQVLVTRADGSTDMVPASLIQGVLGRPSTAPQRPVKTGPSRLAGLADALRSTRAQLERTGTAYRDGVSVKLLRDDADAPYKIELVVRGDRQITPLTTTDEGEALDAAAAAFDAALAKPAAPAAPSTGKAEWTAIGTNAAGETLYENQRGVRSTFNPETGVRQHESVRMVPTREGVKAEIPVRGPQWTVVEPGGKVGADGEGDRRGAGPGRADEPGGAAPDGVRATGAGALGEVPAGAGAVAPSGEPGGAGPSDTSGVPQPGVHDRPDTGAESGDAPDTGKEPVRPGPTLSPTGTSNDPGPRPPDYALTPERIAGIISGGTMARARNNLAAILLTKQLVAEERWATPEEQEVLAKYVGFGDTTLADFLAEYPDYSWRGTEKALWQEYQNATTAEERQALANSSANAHFTYGLYEPIWNALVAAGFQQGRVLEPAVGTGHAFGFMPGDVRANSTLNGVELEPLTASIARALYPSARIQTTGYEAARIARGSQDLIISNVPFAATGVIDAAYPDTVTKQIHNYFFAKALDHVRPGGLIVFITSHYTMDNQSAAVRKYLMDRAHFVGAVRLPNQAFGKSAKTSVVTDLIVLQRRMDGETTSRNADVFLQSPKSEALSSTQTQRGKDVEVNVYRNAWYDAHPELIVGRESNEGQMRRKGEYTVTATSDDVKGAFEKALNEILPPGTYQAATTPNIETPTNHVVEGAFKPGELRVAGDRIVKVDKHGNVSDATPMRGGKVDATGVVRLKAIIGVRDALRATVTAMQNPASTDTDVLKAQVALNTAYKAFNREHGRLNDRANKSLFKEDPEVENLLSLEKLVPKATYIKKKTGEVLNISYEFTGLSDIFDKRTLNAPKEVEHVDTPQDALMSSLGVKTRLDWPYMARITGEPIEVLQQKLRDAGQIFEQTDGSWVIRDEYLSGDVVTKLEDAETAARDEPERFEKNVTALQAVQPGPKAVEDISIGFGAHFVPTSDVGAFMTDELGVDHDAVDITVDATETFVRWTLDFNGEATRAGSQHQLAVRYGPLDYQGNPTLTYGLTKLMSDALNLNQPTLKYKVGEGKDAYWETDEDGTIAARANIEDIRVRWQGWLFEHPEAAGRMTDIYNTRFNREVKRTYDGSHMELPGNALPFRLYPHQLNAIWRMVTSGNTLLAHEVGAGKTFEMIAAAMEWRRTGRATKPMITVPTYLLQQWRAAITEMYPTAKVLAFDSTDLAANKRQRAMARIAFGEWDIVLVPHSSFELLGVSNKRMAAVLQEWVTEIMNAEVDARAERGKDDESVKKLAAMRKRIELKIARKLAAAKSGSDQNLTWEQLGVDALFIDEAQAFKNLFFFSKIDRLRGLSKSESDRSLDLFVKVRDINETSNYRNLVLATATPIMNSMGELYTMQRYLQPQTLRQQGLENFDNWYAMFSQAMLVKEQRPDGTYQEVMRLKKFRNLDLLYKTISKVMDYVGWEDMPYLNLPKLKGGRVRIVQTEPHPMYEQVRQWFERRLDNLRASPPYTDKQGVHHAPDQTHPITGEPVGRFDNIVTVMSHAKLAAIDVRLVLGDAATDYEGSRIQKAADLLSQYYKEEKDKKGVALVFLDVGTPKKIEPLEFLRNVKVEDTTEGGALGTEDDELEPAEGDDVAWEPAELSGVFNLYDALKAELVKRGVPSREIAYIHQAPKPAERLALFQAANEGTIRFLFASTDKGGVGMNIQRRLGAIHHIDAPRHMRPGDIRQRDGRGIRQGNTYKEIDNSRYVTKGSTDEWLYGLLGGKAVAIGQFMHGDLKDYTDEDPSMMSIEEAQMRAAHDPRGIELSTLRTKLPRLQAQAVAAERAIGTAKAAIKTHTKLAETLREEAARVRAWMAANYTDMTGSGFSMDVGGALYKSRTDANVALTTELETVRRNQPTEYATIATIGGLPVQARYYPSSFGNPESVAVRLNTKAYGGESMAITTLTVPTDPKVSITEGRNIVQSLANAYQTIPNVATRADKEAKESDAIVARAEKLLANPPAAVKEYREIEARIKAIEDELVAEGKAKDAARLAAGTPAPVMAPTALPPREPTVDDKARKLLRKAYADATLAELRDVLDRIDSTSLEDVEWPEKFPTKLFSLYGENPTDPDADHDPETLAHVRAVIVASLHHYALAREGQQTLPWSGERAPADEGWKSARDLAAKDSETESAEGVFADAQPAGPGIIQTPTGPRIIRPLPFGLVVEIAQALGSKLRVVRGFRGNPKQGTFSAGTITLHKDLFKQGMEHQLAATIQHELGHFIDYLPTGTMKRGNLLGRLFTLNGYLKQRFTTAGGTVITNKVIAAELTALSNKWRPWDPATATESFIKYRNSAKERFADAISVLFSDPGLLQHDAPVFFREFFDALDKKPEVKRTYFELQDVAAGTPQEIAQHRRRGVRGMFDEADTKAIDLERLRQAEQTAAKQLFMRTRQQFLDKNAPVNDRIDELEKRGVVIHPDDNPRYFLEERNYLGSLLKAFTEKYFAPIYRQLNAAGLDWTTLGELLLYERIAIGDREWVANPKGITAAEAPTLRQELLDSLTPDQQQILTNSLDQYRTVVALVVEQAYHAGLYTDEAHEAMQNNPAYATFRNVDYLDRDVSSAVYKQIGLLKDIQNPADATLLKVLATLRTIERQKMLNATFKLWDTHYTGEMEQAKEAVDSDGRRHVIDTHDPDKTTVKYWEHGRLRGKNVDKYMGQSLTNHSVGADWAFIKALQVINGKWFRPVFTTFNTGYQGVNFVRDLLRYYKRPTSTVVNTVKYYAKGAPMARVRAFGQKANPSQRQQEAEQDLLDAEKAKILGVTYADRQRGRNVEDTVVEDTHARMGVQGFGTPKPIDEIRGFGWSKNLPPAARQSMEAVRSLLLWVEKAGNFIETLPKAAAIYEAKETYGSVKDIPADVRSDIRRKAGSPDFLAGGTLKPVTNEIFLFSNAMAQAVRADIDIATQPKTRAAFWWKTAVINLVPKMVAFAVLTAVAAILKGMSDKDKKDSWLATLHCGYRGVSEYDLTNYTIVPVPPFCDSKGNSIFIRVPQDDIGRMIGGLFWKGLRLASGDRDLIAASMQVLSYMGGQAPMLTPAFKVWSDIGQLAAGQNPYDYYRGRALYTDDEFAALTKQPWQSLKKFVGYEFQQVGGGVVWKFYPGEERPRERTTGQWILDLPVVSNIVGRYLKITNFGQIEQARIPAQEVKAEAAAGREAVKRAVNDELRTLQALPQEQRTRERVQASAHAIVKTLHPNLQPNVDVSDAAEMDPDKQPEPGEQGVANKQYKDVFRKLNMGLVRGQADWLTDAVLATTSADEKIAILLKAAESMSATELQTWLTRAGQHKVVSGKVRAEFNKRWNASRAPTAVAR